MGVYFTVYIAMETNEMKEMFKACKEEGNKYLFNGATTEHYNDGISVCSWKDVKWSYEKESEVEWMFNYLADTTLKGGYNFIRIAEYPEGDEEYIYNGYDYETSEKVSRKISFIREVVIS